ncbi:malate:quinone oxidoreductase [Klebsiella pneumoniae]
MAGLPVGAPPMSVPHLDARYLDGKRVGAVWAIRHLLDQVPEKWFVLRSAQHYHHQ